MPVGYNRGAPVVSTTYLSRCLYLVFWVAPWSYAVKALGTWPSFLVIQST